MPYAAVAHAQPSPAPAQVPQRASARHAKPPPFYRPRDHAASPFFKVVRDHFDEFERVYPERFQEKYGFWRPVIRTSIDKFLKCGDVKEGFARVRCPDCRAEFFVAYSCRQRSCCPSCDQKRALLLAHRLKVEVFAPVPHRQWVFTIPKRLRIFFRYDRSLLGKLCRAAYETVREVYERELEGDCGVPAMVGAVQTFGDLANFHSHVHSVVAEGVFTESGHFVPILDVCRVKAAQIWQERVFEFLIAEDKIDLQTAASMREWKHSGFNVDTSVKIDAQDPGCMQRVIEYIARCPLSLARMVSVTDGGNVVYKASTSKCIPFPKPGDKDFTSGVPRNFEVFDPLDFLATVTQHIPNKGEHQIKFYGWYSNKTRGLQKKKGQQPATTAGKPEGETEFIRKRRLTWAALIKAVYEVDPLKCPNCGGTMKIIGFIERHQSDVIQRILRHCGLWKDAPPRPPPPQAQPRELEVLERVLDFGFFESTCI